MREFRLVNIVGIMSELITGEGNRTQNWFNFSTKSNLKLQFLMQKPSNRKPELKHEMKIN